MTFSLDGKYAYPSTGEVIDTKTKKIVAKLTDEKGREVHSEKMIEIHVRDGKPVANGDQFGVGLTPDEKEVWVVDACNQQVHVFDNTTDPPAQRQSIKLREQPGWVTFSLDGKYGYPSTGEVIDAATKKIMYALKDEKGREVHSEKMLEVHFEKGRAVKVGDQFGVGRAIQRETK